MADKRISQLVERVDIANNDVLPIVASGATTTNKATISSIQTFMQENLDVGVTSVGITIGTSGTDVNVTGSPVTTSGNITINIPTASATNRGLLSAADWVTFNSKQDAGSFVTLDTAQTITAQKTFTTSGSSDTMIISHGSGSGFALDVIKAGDGEAIRIQKTSGSGNAVTITGGLLSAEAASFSGNIAANGNLTLAAAGSANPTILRNTSGTTSSTTGSNVIGFNGVNNIFVSTQSRGGFILGFNNSVSNREYTLPDASGTIALTSNLGAYLPLTGGTLTGALSGTSASFSGDLTIDTNTFFVDSTNNRVGVGTLSPATPFHILTSGLPAIRLTLGSEARVHNINGVNNGRDLNVLPFRNFSIQTGNGITEGIITLNAYEDFVVGTGSSYTPRLTIASTGAATFSSSVTADYLTANSGALINTTSNQLVLFNSGGGGNAKRFGLLMTNADIFKIYAQNDNGTTRTDNIITATINGNVGIGTATPGGKLEVNGQTNIINGAINFGGSGVAGSTDPAIYRIAGLNDMAFAIGSTERMRITSDGYARLSTSSGGIQFNGDTAAANALDDYEEGTWTIGISFGGASSGITYSLNQGTYTKVGRKVTVTGLLSMTSKGSSTGNAKITGLPFGVPNNNAFYSAASLYITNVSFLNVYTAIAVPNTSTLDLYEITTLGASSLLTNADFSNNIDLVISLTYFV